VGRERHISDDGRNVVRRDRLEQAGDSLTMFPSVLEAAMPPRNSRNWVEEMVVRDDAARQSLAPFIRSPSSWNSSAASPLQVRKETW